MIQKNRHRKWTVKSIFGSVRCRIPEDEKNPAVGENDFTDILGCSKKETVCGINHQSIAMSKYSPLIEPEPPCVEEQGEQYVHLPGALMDEPELNDGNTTVILKHSLKEKEKGHGTNPGVKMEEFSIKDIKSLKRQKAREEKERKRGEKVEAELQKRLAKSEKKLDKETERRKKVKAALNTRIQEDKEVMKEIQGEINDLKAKIDKKVEKIDAMKAQRKTEKDKPLSWKLDMDFHIKKSLLRQGELCGERDRLFSSKKKIRKRIKKYDYQIRSGLHILSDKNRKLKPVPPCFFADSLIPPKENKNKQPELDNGKPGLSDFQNQVHAFRQNDDMHSSNNRLNRPVARIL